MKLKREEALEILELEVDGVFPTEPEIKKQYRLLAMKWHPDKNPGNEDEAKIAFQRVHAAYQLLMKGPDYDSDGEESDSDDMDSDEAFACFMDMLSQMGLMEGMGRNPGLFFSFSGGHFTAAGPGPDFMGRSGGGQGMPGFGQQHGGGRPVYFEEVSDEDDYYDSEEDDDEVDDGGEYQYYKAQQQRERARQEAQERERQRRAEELRARQQEQRQKLTEEERRKNEERLEAEAKARALAQETEMLRKLISQLPRPTMAERAETSITLSMARLAKATGDNQLPKGCRWEMDMRAQSEPAWHSIHSSSSTSAVTATGLTPGTKYVFRARAGRKMPEGGMEWGKYSEESFYATMGRHPAPSTQPSGQQSADSGQPGQSKKGRRREAAASRKEQQHPQPQKSAEVDMDEAKRRLKAEKEREAAIKAAMERAAADYHRETEQLAAQKAETEAKLAEKVRRSRMKARRKEEAVEPAPKGEEAASQPPPPPPPPQAPKPPERDLNDYADAFGSVRRIDAHQTSSTVANGGWYATDEEELSLEEAIQLSLALEESERYAKEEAAMRSKLQYNETSFPSLGGGGNNNDWGALDDAEPQPPAKLGPIKPTSAPPAPSTMAPPPAAPYRESKRAPPASQPSAGGFYSSGNVRMAPAQVHPVRVPPTAVPPVPPVPRSVAPPAPQPSPGRIPSSGNVRMAPVQVAPVKVPPVAVPPVPSVPRSMAPPPLPPQLYRKPYIVTNGQGVFTEDDIIRQSRGLPSMQANGVRHKGAVSQEVPLQRPGAAVPQSSAVPNGHAYGRPRYNPLNSGPNYRPNGGPSGHAPPPASTRAASASAEPMAVLFPHLFPNAAA